MKSAHSTTKKKDKNAQKRTQILAAVLEHVPFDGWTELALVAGLKTAKVSAKETDLLFPGGIVDVVQFWGEQTDDAMHERIKAERGFARMKVREKVGLAVRARLEILTPHREAMKRLMLWYAMPMHAMAGVKRVAKTADLIWQAAGDTSTDYNFYTKRLLLGAVMKTTMLFWINDETLGCKATWEFLDRRISEVVRAGKAISLAREWKPSEMVEMIQRKFTKSA